MSDSTKKVKVIIIVSAGIAVLAMAAVVISFVLNSSTRKVSRYLSIANEYYDDEDYKQAISEFENVLSIDERNVDAYLGIADAYEELADAAGEKGNYKKEEKYLNKALKTLEEGYDITDDDEIKDRIEDISEKVEKAEKNREDEAAETSSSSAAGTSSESGKNNGVNVDNDNFTLTCTKVQLLNDSDGKPAAEIFFIFTNKTSDPLSMHEVFTPSVTQSGVLCGTNAVIIDGPAELANMDVPVSDGESIECCYAINIQDFASTLTLTIHDNYETFSAIGSTDIPLI